MNNPTGLKSIPTGHIKDGISYCVIKDNGSGLCMDRPHIIVEFQNHSPCGLRQSFSTEEETEKWLNQNHCRSIYPIGENTEPPQWHPEEGDVVALKSNPSLAMTVIELPVSGVVCGYFNADLVYQQVTISDDRALKAVVPPGF